MGSTGLILLIILGIIVYFIPTIVAWNKKHSTGMNLLNVFLGWTISGWLGSLIWAACDPPKEQEIQLPEPEDMYTYTCDRCGYELEIKQRLKLFVCPHCKHEDKVDWEHF